MFRNVENKLKILAKINFICGCILAVIVLILGLGTYDYGPLIGIVSAVLIVFAGLVSSWLIYGYAEIIECAKEIRSKKKPIQFDNSLPDL